jgi:hypothetical protein
MGSDIKPERLVKAPSPPIYANVNPRATQKNVSIDARNAPTKPTSQPIQTQNANEQEIPVSEEAAKADNEYKSMILGDN